MDYSKATDEQLKTIIEWDNDIPTHFLKELYEEVMNRRIYDDRIKRWIYKYFRYPRKAEEQTGVSVEDLLWICYEAGHESLKDYKPNQPFMVYWYSIFLNRLIGMIRKHTAQKRTGDVCSLEGMNEWTVPGGNHTEPIALNRVYIESIMNQLTDKEKEIVIKRYQGYTFKEIAAIQGMSVGCIQKRITLYRKRIKGA